jgi:hypothetical protein
VPSKISSFGEKKKVKIRIFFFPSFNYCTDNHSKCPTTTTCFRHPPTAQKVTKKIKNKKKKIKKKKKKKKKKEPSNATNFFRVSSRMM